MPQGLDIILIVIMIISGLLAMLRGLTREMLSIMSWGLSALITLLAFTQFRDFMERQLSPHQLADGLLIVAVFLTCLVLFSIVTIKISDRLLDSSVGAVDRTLGFVYGMARGLLLVVISYHIIVMIAGRDKLPYWVKDARSLWLIEPAGETIKSLLPDNPDSWFNRRVKPTSPPAS